MYCDSECVPPFASGSEKSGAALPTGGGSKAKTAEAINDVTTDNNIFVFIDWLETYFLRWFNFLASNTFATRRRNFNQTQLVLTGTFRPGHEARRENSDSSNRRAAPRIEGRFQISKTIQHRIGRHQ